MCRKIFLSVILLCLILPSVAQNKYWVFFTDKKDVTFDPYSYFDKKAIQRRERCHLPLFDSTDMPVKDQYIQAVQNLSDSVGYSTRWFNAVVAWLQPDQKMKVESLPFVSSVEEMEGVSNVCSVQSWDTTLNSWEAQILNRQTESMQASLFKQKGIDGKGVRIAIFDAGFPTVDVNPAFEKIRNEGRILNTWDFVHNKKFVYAYNAHGTNTFSCIAGMIGDKQIGLATGAEFILARTERSGEPYSEEQNWLAAVEWADKNGADIVNSSLGYTYHRYFPWDMDGKKSLVTRAGNLAARKGILIVNAAGNDGDNQWHVMGAPADADSVLTVGGIDPNGEYHTDFSSYGPTADLRMKPNVCAYGHVIASGKNGLNKTQGTSFSSPLVCGFAACALQTDTTLTNMQLFKKIEESGDMFPYYDYAHGYGVPQAYFFLEKVKPEIVPSFEIINNDTMLFVHIFPEFLNEERKDRELLFYSRIVNAAGVIRKYYVVDATKQFIASEIAPEHIFSIWLSELEKGERIEYFYKGYMTGYEKK